MSAYCKKYKNWIFWYYICVVLQSVMRRVHSVIFFTMIEQIEILPSFFIMHCMRVIFQNVKGILLLRDIRISCELTQEQVCRLCPVGTHFHGFFPKLDFFSGFLYMSLILGEAGVRKALFLPVNEPKKTGARSARRVARSKPTGPLIKVVFKTVR